MRVLGMISGTSFDGIDTALVDFHLDGDVLRGTVLYTDTSPYPAPLRELVMSALPPRPITAQTVCRLDTEVGQAFAAAAQQALAAAASHGPADAICSHGQTVYHWVEGGRARGTLQLGQSAWIAQATGLPVVADVRARDVAAGGQGAPLVSLLDALVLAGRSRPAVALNLGGIANITVVDPTGPVVAFDTGPANALVDAVVQERGLDPNGFDTDGRLAAAGHVDAALLELLLQEPYYRAPAPKSTGKELFNIRYVAEALRAVPVADHCDVVATLTELTARTVADSIRATGADYVMASGGGVRNPVLLARLRALLPGVEVVDSAAHGLPPDAKEAVLMALIGWHTLNGLPATIASATGAAQSRILGSITPGSGPLVLPAPATAPARAEFRS